MANTAKTLEMVLGELRTRPAFEVKHVDALGVDVRIRRITAGEYLDLVCGDAIDKSPAVSKIVVSVVCEDGSRFFPDGATVRALPALALTALSAAVEEVNALRMADAKNA